jgi:hypothetical protein
MRCVAGLQASAEQTGVDPRQLTIAQVADRK